MADISNSADVIDVRDIIARVEELETELIEVKEGRSSYEAAEDLGIWCEDVLDEAYFPFEEAAREYLLLSGLLAELAGNGGDEQWRGDWYPVTLIRDSYFKDYAQELAEDIGAVNPDTGWPNNCIDWDQAARELRMDYSSTELDGVTYWYR